MKAQVETTLLAAQHELPDELELNLEQIKSAGGDKGIIQLLFELDLREAEGATYLGCHCCWVSKTSANFSGPEIRV